MQNDFGFLPLCERTGLVGQRRAGWSSRGLNGSIDSAPFVCMLAAALCCFGEKDAELRPFRTEPDLPHAVSGLAQLRRRA